jgi:hypothetical protein
MKDVRFFQLSFLVIVTLICSNFPMFVKSLADSKFQTPELRKAAQKVKVDELRKQEQDFWVKVKTVDFDKNAKKSEPTVIPTNFSTALNYQINAYQKNESLKEKPYLRFLFVGDSIMYDLGIALQSQLQDYNVNQTKLDYKVSTGLNRTDVYDWFARTQELINTYKPDAVVVLFGGNDDQDIIDAQGNYQPVLTDQWKKAYRERVERIAKIVSNSSTRKLYWVGHPVTDAPRYKQFFQVFNQIYSEVDKSYPKMEYVPCWDVFMVDGQYIPTMADKSGNQGYVRVQDGVHFTPHGANIVANRVVEEMLQDDVLMTSKHAKK